jgi:hypothetical protein
MKLSFLLFAGAVICSSVLRADPAIVYSNLGSGPGFDPINSLSVNEGVAVPFTVTLTAPDDGHAYVLSDIQIAASDGDSTDTVDVGLFDNTGGGGTPTTPGAELDSIGIDLSTTAGLVTADSVTQPVLVTGDTYWVVLTSFDANGAATWNYNGLGLSGAATETAGIWTYNPTAYTQGAVVVDADLVVSSAPEPGTLLMFAAGLSAILMAGRRRIRQ